MLDIHGGKLSRYFSSAGFPIAPLLRQWTTCVLEMEGPQRFQRAVGNIKAINMALTKRLIDAGESERGRLGSRILSIAALLATRLPMAKRIREFSLMSVPVANESSNSSFKATFADGVMLERRLFEPLFAMAHQKEGMNTFLHKRNAALNR